MSRRLTTSAASVVLALLGTALPGVPFAPLASGTESSGVRPQIVTVQLTPDAEAAEEVAVAPESADLLVDGAESRRQLSALLSVPSVVLSASGSPGGQAIVGVTWDEGSVASGVTVTVRTRTDEVWTPWEPIDAAPTDPAIAGQGTRAGTEPYFVGDVDEVEARLHLQDGNAPANATLAIIDPGAAPTDATMNAAAAPLATALTGPRIRTRAEWGADESLMTWRPVEGEVTGAVVHHTAGANGYSAEQVPGIIRGVYAYHAVTRGWGDIGYNVLVDRFGRIWEGRAGGIERPIVGGHAIGANSTMFGLSVLGDYTKTTPSPESLDAVADLIAWKLALHGVVPTGTGHVNGAAYPAVIGHRDVSSTSCPGSIYDSLGWLRNTAASYQSRYMDVFGMSLGQAHLQRTLTNPTVYVVTGSMKHPVRTMDLFSSLAPLGPLRFVGASVLAGKTTGLPMQRAVIGPDGTVYFVDAGIKLPFTSCAQVADYGFSCASLVRLDSAALDRLHRGPAMTSVYRTTTGKSFLVTGGTKREVADDASLLEAGRSTESVTLLESGIGHLPYGDPVIRSGIVLQERGSTHSVLVDGDRRVPVPEVLRTATRLSTLPTRALDAASIALLSLTAPLDGLASDGTGAVWILHAGGRTRLEAGLVDPASVPRLSDGVLGLFPDAGTVEAGQFLKGTDDVGVYRFAGGSLHRLRSWHDLLTFTGGSQPQIVSIDHRSVDLLPRGPAQLGPGSLVVSTSSSTVYLVDGVSGLVPLTTFSISAALGATTLITVPPQDLAGYTVRPSNLTTSVQCGSTLYLGVSGRLYPVSSAVAAEYGFTHQPLDELTCTGLRPSEKALGRFLQSESGTIYWVEQGRKRPIGSWSTYLALGGNAGNTVLADRYTLQRLPDGALR